MPFVVVTTTSLKRVGTDTANNVFTMTLEDGTVLHGTATWPHYPSYKFALDPAFYPDEVVAAISEVYELLIAETITSHEASLEENPNYFNADFASLSPRVRAEHTVNRDGIEAIITSAVEEGHPEVMVKIGFPYSADYRKTLHYRSPIAKLAVE